MSTTPAGLEKTVWDFLRKEVSNSPHAGSPEPNLGKILLAVSAGPDSMALLHAMYRLHGMGLFHAEFFCAHVNHQLRGAESGEDERFSIEQAAALSLLTEVRRVDVRRFARDHKLSLETAGRELRLKALSEIAKMLGCRWIATGHQKNDNAETVIQRLVRGTGFRGLAGIWPRRRLDGGIEIVRPLLYVTRIEILDYLRERNIPCRQDRSNRDYSYNRNYVRHRLLPSLERQSKGSIVELLFELSRSAQRLHTAICRKADESWGRVTTCADRQVVVDAAHFGQLPIFVQTEIARRGVITIGGRERNLSRKHYDAIRGLATAGAGKERLTLPDGVLVRRQGPAVIFSSAGTQAQPSQGALPEVRLNVPGQTRFGPFLIDAQVLHANGNRLPDFQSHKTPWVEWFDLGMIGLPIQVDVRKGGEHFRPLGMPVEKRLGKFLTAAKVDPELRERVIIVRDRQRVIWVCPVRMAEPVKVTQQTREILQLRVTDATTKPAPGG